jgi:hypothetical protein
VKAIFMHLIVADRAHLERSWPKHRFTQLELPAERGEMLQGFSFMLSHVEETARRIVELGLLEAHDAPVKAFSGSRPHRCVP